MQPLSIVPAAPDPAAPGVPCGAEVATTIVGWPGCPLFGTTGGCAPPCVGCPPCAACVFARSTAAVCVTPARISVACAQIVAWTAVCVSCGPPAKTPWAVGCCATAGGRVGSTGEGSRVGWAGGCATCGASGAGGEKGRGKISLGSSHDTPRVLKTTAQAEQQQ